MYHSSYINKLDHELERIFKLEPNDLHIPLLTNIYKVLTRPLKSLPIVFIIPVSLGAALVMHLALGPWMVRIVSLLQYGF